MIGNDTAQADPQDACVPQLVAMQAAATPDAMAVCAGGVITYRDLNWQANQLAHHLRRLGAGPETLVALCLERAPALVVGALGVLKSGAAYMPLDPTYPSERLAFMLNDSQAPILVTRRSLAGRLPAGRWQFVDLEADAELIARYPVDPPEADLKLGNLAYVVYTSGSTGRPKGVEIIHDSLLNLVSWHRRTFAVTPSDRATLHASPGFDASVWELWPYLAAGASVHFPDQAICADAEALRDWLLEERITITFLPTAIAERIMALAWPTHTALRVLLTGGETLHRRPLPGLPFVVVNNYGPTEFTVVASSGIVSARDKANGRPSIGRPISNTEIYILDEQLKRVPAGLPGELHIGGKGLARGYLNRPELNAEKFIRASLGGEARPWLYKTGDLARHRADGNIECLGRTDTQVKVRGFRIELEEIECALRQHPAVIDACATLREDAPGDVRLAAYVTPLQQPSCLNEIRSFLKERLPSYMVPVLTSLQQLPLTPNGKLNRQALPPLHEPAADDGKQLVRESSDPIEQLLTRLWTETLKVPQVNVYDNFFDLGGHSLLATQMVAKLEQEVGVRMKARELAFQTLGQFAASCREKLQCR